MIFSKYLCCKYRPVFLHLKGSPFDGPGVRGEDNRSRVEEQEGNKETKKERWKEGRKQRKKEINYVRQIEKEKLC